MAEVRTACNALPERHRVFERVPFGSHLRFWRSRPRQLQNVRTKGAAAAEVHRAACSEQGMRRRTGFIPATPLSDRCSSVIIRRLGGRKPCGKSETGHLGSTSNRRSDLKGRQDVPALVLWRGQGSSRTSTDGRSHFVLCGKEHPRGGRTSRVRIWCFERRRASF